MSDNRSIVVYLETKRFTMGGADWKGLHRCDYAGNSVPFADLAAVKNRLLTPDDMALLYSVRAAAEELGCALTITDLGQMRHMEKSKHKRGGLPVPRVSVGDQFIAGAPTKAQIVELYLKMRAPRSTCHENLDSDVQTFEDFSRSQNNTQRAKSE